MATKSSKRPAAYLLWGQEEGRKKDALAALIEELVPAEDRDLDVQYLDASSAGLTAETILHAARDRAMFSEQRVVVVLNAGRLRGPRHQRTQDALATGIATLPEWSTVILYAYAEDADERKGKAPYGEGLMGALKKCGKVLSFPLLKPEELADIATREAARLGKRLAPAAAAQIGRNAGPDSRTVLNEVRKLAAYVGDAPSISPADVSELIPTPGDDSIWHFLDAAFGGDGRRAVTILREMEAQGESMHAIIPRITTNVRSLAQAKLLIDHKVRSDTEYDDLKPEVRALLPESQHVYKGKSAWQRKRLWEQAAGITWTQAHRALDRLAVLDAGCKGWEQGIEDPAMALEVYVVSLAASVRRAPAQQSGYRRY